MPSILRSVSPGKRAACDSIKSDKKIKHQIVWCFICGLWMDAGLKRDVPSFEDSGGEFSVVKDLMPSLYVCL